jgi:RNA-binding protein 25
LRQWEAREKRKASDYDYERDDDEAKRSKSEKDKKRLMEFLEHYDDDKSDNRYYKGNDWLRRREDRNMEIESDAVDRKREEDEMEALRLEVMERQIREREEQERKKLESEKMEGMQNNHGNGHNEEEEVDMIPPDIDESVPLAKQDNKPSFPPIKIQLAPPVDGPGGTEIKSNPNELTSTDILDDDQKKSTKLSISLKSTAAARGPLPEVFGGEEEQEDVKPKKKVYSLMSNPNSAHITTAMVLAPSEEKMNIEDRKKLVQSLVNSIPSRREELFNWDLKWDYIDKTLMDKRVAPWIDKKIIEYIGEPEPTLTEFVCNKLSEHVSAEAILDDIAVVLDDEAEVFILKLWRLLIYETEAKHLGIAKNY